MRTNYNIFKIVTFALLLSCNSWSQIKITQWNFNGASATTVPGGTTAPTPIIGTGSATLVGGTTATFASGISSGGSTDPVITVPENYGWNTTNYPALGLESKQRGVQFDVSTLGFQGITFKFDQRLSNSSNNTYIAQYTTDRTVAIPTWVDAQTFTFAPGVSGTTGGDVWYNSRTVSLIAVTALDNNPNAGFRVVSAFDPTTNNYNSSTMMPIVYAVTGTSRFDMVTILADNNLGIDQFSATNSDFTIFPNPSNKEVVNFNQIQDIEVFDVSGKLVLKVKNTKSIDTKSFNAGVYIIKTTTGITRKLIVK